MKIVIKHEYVFTFAFADHVWGWSCWNFWHVKSGLGTCEIVMQLFG